MPSSLPSNRQRKRIKPDIGVKAEIPNAPPPKRPRASNISREPKVSSKSLSEHVEKVIKTLDSRSNEIRTRSLSFLILMLSSATPSQYTLKEQMSISSNFGKNTEFCSKLTQILLEKLRQERDEDICVLVIRLLTLCISNSLKGVGQVVQTFCDLLNSNLNALKRYDAQKPQANVRGWGINELPTEVVLQLVSSLSGIKPSSRVELSMEQNKLVMDAVSPYLNSLNNRVRCKALEVIGNSCSFSDEQSPSTWLAISQIGEYTLDDSQFVRRTALKTLVDIRSRTGFLPVALYPKVVRCLGDLDKKVQVHAIELLHELVQLHPKHSTVNVHSDTQPSVAMAGKRRLAEEGFVRLSGMLESVHAEVRAKCAETLGKFTVGTGGVSIDTLLQSLSKKPTKKEAYETKSDLLDIPEGDTDFRSLSEQFIRSAPGAFVHGLEDEFQKVRAASVVAMCELCLKCKEFAESAIESLIYMFNDEIDEVRVLAISAIGKIVSSAINLNPGQLQLVLALLGDTNIETRVAVFKLLETLVIPDVKSMISIITSLCECIQRYDQDFKNVLNLCKTLGVNPAHREVIEALSEHLDLKYLLSQKAAVGRYKPDTFCTLALAYNNSADNLNAFYDSIGCQSLLILCCIHKHTNCFFKYNADLPRFALKTESNEIQELTRVLRIFRRMKVSIVDISPKGLHHLKTSLHELAVELSKTAERGLNGTRCALNFYGTYVAMADLFLQALDAVLYAPTNDELATLISKTDNLCKKMLLIYTNLSHDDKYKLLHVQFCLHFLRCTITKSGFEILKEFLQSLEKFGEGRGMKLPRVVGNLKDIITESNANDLQSQLNKFAVDIIKMLLFVPEVSSGLRMFEANFHPAMQDTGTIRHGAQSSISIQVLGTIKNLSNVHNVRILVYVPKRSMQKDMNVVLQGHMSGSDDTELVYRIRSSDVTAGRHSQCGQVLKINSKIDTPAPAWRNGQGTSKLGIQIAAVLRDSFGYTEVLRLSKVFSFSVKML